MLQEWQSDIYVWPLLFIQLFEQLTFGIGGMPKWLFNLTKELKDEFDVLYKEGKQRRRMMSISAHDRLAGTPARVKALDDFITYAKQHKGVKFMRKDYIAKWILRQDNVPKNSPRTFEENLL